MKAAQLRSLLEGDRPFLVPGVFDALSANIAESAGFDAVYLGGNNAGASTGATEPIITMTEMADRSREILHNVEVPLVVDGGAGFGDAPHTYRTVDEFAKTGIAGVHIEDQVYPKPIHYHAHKHAIVDTDEMVRKVKAAAKARDVGDSDIVLMARTDAARGNLREEGQTIEDAVERINAYADAGAEVGMIAPQTVEEVEYAAAHTEIPVSFAVVEFESASMELTVEDIADIGYSMIFYPLSAMLVTTRALDHLYGSIADSRETTLDAEESRELLERVDELIDLPALYEIESGGEQLH